MNQSVRGHDLTQDVQHITGDGARSTYARQRGKQIKDRPHTQEIQMPSIHWHAPGHPSSYHVTRAKVCVREASR